MKKNITKVRYYLKFLCLAGFLAIFYLDGFGYSIPQKGFIQHTFLDFKHITAHHIQTFVDDICKENISKFVKAPLPYPNNFATSSPTSGCIEGNVFEDFNFNGTDDTNEPGVQGIYVVVHDCANTLMDTVYTDTEGDWQVCDLTDGTAYRVEFVLPESVSSWAKPTHTSTGGNQSNIQFLTAPACTQFSVSRPSDYCEENPLVGLPCFVGQPYDGIYADSAAIVSFRVENTGETDDSGYIKPTVLATHNQVGSVWGHARNSLTQESFYAAYLKRGAGMGPSGTGAIYKIDANGVVSTYIDINTLFSGTPAGADPHTYSGDPTNVFYDIEATPFVGKIAFGDIDLSITGDTLFAVNLNDKQLYLIPTNITPTASNVTIINLPQPTDCIEDDTRPFGIGVDKNGHVYIGYVCGNESTTSPDGLEAYVYRWDGGTSFSNVLQFDLTFDRGTGNSDWENWGDDSGNSPVIRDDDPMFSDIEFQGQDMILAFRNRLGDKAYRPSLHVSGDIYKACWNGVSWDFEQGGSCGGVVGASPGTVATPNAAGGPGGGYFYDNSENGIVSQGSVLTYLDNQVVDVVIDPYGALSAGLFTYDSNGGRINRYEVYQSPGGTPVEYTFGKINGLGDIAALCNPAPLEIGNYIWCDSLRNGIQDACERGINNIIVQLYDRNGALVGQDTTSNSGQYYFNQNNVDTTGITVDGSGIATSVNSWSGMSYSTQYFIVFGGGQFAASEFTIGGDTYGITSFVNAGSNDNIDSDVDGSSLTVGTLGARPDGLPFIDMATSATGCGDHKYDLGITCVPICDLTLSYTQASCMDNTNGTFTATYDLMLNWENPPTTGDLTLTLYGDGTLNTTTVSAATIASGTSMTLSAAFTVPADGNGNTGILAVFNNDTVCKDSIGFKAPAPCPDDVATCASTSGCLGGNVFEDFNCNGTDDAEPGVRGIEIQIYDCNNALVGTGYSDSDGDWQICSLTDGTAYRVEFVLPESVSCWAKPTHISTGGNQSNIQFLTAPACTQFSVSNPSDYCQANPDVITTCFVRGDQINNLDVLVSLPYNLWETTQSTGSANKYEALSNQIGTTLGLAYHKNSDNLFAAAFQKRHTGYANGSTGTIYRIEKPNDALHGNADGGIAPDVFLDLNTLFGSNILGDNPHPTGSNFVEDFDSYDRAGKIAFGDIDLSEDEQTLWAINLNDRSLYKIPLGNDLKNPVAPTMISQIDIFPLYNLYDCNEDGLMDNETDIDLRPFALKSYRGKLYIGAVCSAESTVSTSDSNGDETKLRGLVFEFDPIISEFQQVLDFPLNFARGCGAETSGCDGQADWRAWSPVLPRGAFGFHSEVTANGSTTHYVGYPQPMLSDIEFAEDGTMLLGFRDRFGDQTAGRNGSLSPPPATGSDPDIYAATAVGDILRAQGNPTDGWSFSVVEATDGTEFFGGDFYDFSSTISQHAETSMGGLAVLKGVNQVAYTVLDPETFQSAGIDWASNNVPTTAPVGIYTIYETSQNSTTFGKANGLGELEILCNPAPLEIGNYIWCDSVQNGIQDACERGINNILVSLYDRNGVLVGQDTSSNSGQYYFNQNNVDTTGITVDGSGIATPVNSWSGMSYSTQYFIVFGGGQFAASEFTIGGDTYGITPMANVDSNDNIDSDVDGSSLTAGTLGTRPDNLPFIDMTTSAIGCGEHKYDLGLTCTDCPIQICWPIKAAKKVGTN